MKPGWERAAAGPWILRVKGSRAGSQTGSRPTVIKKRIGTRGEAGSRRELGPAGARDKGGGGRDFNREPPDLVAAAGGGEGS